MSIIRFPRSLFRIHSAQAVGTLLMFLDHSDLCHELASTSSRGTDSSNGRVSRWWLERDS